MILRILFIALMSIVLPAFAGAPDPVTLEPIKHRRASLTLVSPEGKETVYTPADLEKLPTYRITTTTPWREEPAVFDGILLSDLLTQHGLNTASAINVIAENDYTVKFTNDVWGNIPILIVTRVNGKAHTRRARGPIQFVIDQETFKNSKLAKEKYLVWMAARIELAQ